MKRRHDSITNRALLALREQVNLVNWWESEDGEQFGKYFMQSEKEKKVGTGNIGDNLGALENYKLDRASTYWVTADMQALIEHAAKSMPGQALALDDLPSPFGFVWFENIIEQLDAHAQPISWRAMAWMPAQTVNVTGAPELGTSSGVHLTYYTDVLVHSPDEFPEEPMSQYGGEAKAQHRRDWLSAGYPRLMLLHENGWMFGHDYRGRLSDDQIDVEIDEQTKARILSDSEFWTRQFVAATWTIMGQKIAAKSHPHIPKTDYRSAARSLSVPPEIIFVDLRKVVRPKDEHEDDEAGEVHWNHRWIVDGHWRNQYLPSTGGHRLQWIHPFVKGPDDRPLIVKDRVHRVVR